MSRSRALEDHRHKAAEAHKYYVDCTKLCAEEWKEIADLEGRSLLPEEYEHLIAMKRKFSVVLSADYQMSKLVPYWGASSQPGSTYYLQKLSHDIYGIVNHATNNSKVYLFDERIGPKNTDHTISYTTHYISTLPSWVRRVHLFLDNTCSTNKNAYLMGGHGRLLSKDIWIFSEYLFSLLDIQNLVRIWFSRELLRHTTAVMSFQPPN